MIVVTGATGHVGAHLVARLAAAGHKVRAVTRRPDSLDPPPSVEVVPGDADEPASLGTIFDGADRAFLMSAQQPGSADRPTHVPRLVEAAVRAGLGHVVLLSVYSGGTGGDVIADWYGRIEQAVISSGLGWTLLRPGRFMTNTLQWAPQVRSGDEVRIPFADRPAASIDPADIAAVAAAALTGDGHHGRTYQLSGPQALTPIGELAALSRLLGRRLRAVEPSLDEIRAGMTRGGVPDAVIEAIIARTRDSHEGNAVLPTVQQLLDHPPTTFTRWATSHIHEFTR